MHVVAAFSMCFQFSHFAIVVYESLEWKDEYQNHIVTGKDLNKQKMLENKKNVQNLDEFSEKHDLTNYKF